MSKLYSFLFNKIAFAFLVAILSTSAISEIFQLGDLAPLGAPDGELNAADSLILQRMILGEIAATENEKKLGDVAPLGNSDGILNIGDLVVLQRAILGEITLGPIDISLLQPPVLIAGTTPTTDNPYTILGTATPNTLVDIYVEGQLQQTITSQADGTFSVDAYLFDGFNSIYAAETDGDFSSLASNSLQVQYDNNIDRDNLPANISVDTVWTAGGAQLPYVIPLNLTVDVGVKLILMPGTVLQFASGQNMVVNGTLNVLGTALEPVVFTNQAGITWAGITVTNTATDLNLDYVTIENATTGINIESGDGIISNSVIQGNSVGITLRNASPLIQFSQIIDNTQYGLFILWQSSPIITSNIITGNGSGMSLTGFNNSIGYYPQPIVNNNQIINNGSINISTNNYFYSGAIPQVDFQNNWWGTTDITEISALITDYNDFPVNKPVVNFTGFLSSASGPAEPGNFLPGGSAYDALPGGNGLSSNTVYQVMGNLSVPAGETLTIPEGVQLQFPKGIQLVVYGSLIVEGTNTAPVVLTNQSLDAWGGIVINNLTPDVNLNYLVVENAATGITITGSNGIISNSVFQGNSIGMHLVNASPQIQFSQIIDNTTYGLYLTQQSSPTITSNSISDNGTGIFLYGSTTVGNYPQPIVNNNQIINNGSNNVSTSTYYYSAAIPQINFQNNWWGTTNITVISALIYDYTDNTASRPVVDFSGFLSSAGGSAESGVFLSGGSLYDTLPGGNGLSGNTVYQVTGTLSVPVGETLTIPEGVQLQFPAGIQLVVNGSLIVEGTNTAPVVFTNQDGDTWGGIAVNSSASGVNINYAVVENALTAMTVISSDVVIRNSIFQNNSHAITISTSNGQIYNNILRDNTGGIVLTNASPLIENNQIINCIGSSAITLYFQSSPVISSNLISGNSSGIGMSGNSTIGNYPLPIVNNNQIYNNGATNVSASSYFYSGETPLINFQNNWWGTTDASIIEISINDYIDNPNNFPVIDYSGFLTAANGTAVAGSYLPGGNRFDSQFGGNGLITGTAYQVLGDIIVPAGETLTIPEGVRFRIPKGTRINVYGSLIVNGSSNLPVVFTSSAETPAMSDWVGILAYNNASVVIDYAVIEYADYGVQFVSGSSGSVSHSIITDARYGIYVQGLSNPVIDSNTIVNNTYGVYLVNSSGEPSPTITNNDIYSNITKNLSLGGSTFTTPLNISGNWWGTDNITAIRASISGTNNESLVLLDNIAMLANNSAIPLNLSILNTYISPTSSSSIGTKDSTTITALLSAVGSWSVDVTNSSNQIVKTYPLNSSSSISIIWDGKNDLSQALPDGKYYFQINVDGVKTRSFSVIIDNTSPIAIITSPLTNVTITTTSALNITGTSSDVNIDFYTIELASSHTPIESDYSTLTSTQLSAASSLFAWLYNDINGVQEYGEKTLRLTVTDKAGNKSVQTVPITLDYLAITNASISSDYINPDNGDSVNIAFTLVQPATVTLRIYNEIENRIGVTRGLLGDSLVPGTKLIYETSQIYSTAGNHSLNWNGLDNSSNKIPQDSYRYELTVTNGVENNVYYPEPALVTYSGAPAIVQTIDYAQYGFYKNEYITLTASIPSSTIVRLVLNPVASLDPAEKIPVLNKVVEGGDYTFLIDGRNGDGKAVNSGLIINTAAAATVYEKDPNAIFVNSPSPVLLGTEPHPDIEIKSNPYHIKYSYDQVSSIAFTVSEESYVTVDLMDYCIKSNTICSTDPAVASVKTIIDNELLAENDDTSSTIHTFEWRGYDFEAVNADTNNLLTDEEGYYTFLITATSATTGLITKYRGSLLLYH